MLGFHQCFLGVVVSLFLWLYFGNSYASAQETIEKTCQTLPQMGSCSVKVDFPELNQPGDVRIIVDASWSFNNKFYVANQVSCNNAPNTGSYTLFFRETFGAGRLGNFQERISSTSGTVTAPACSIAPPVSPIGQSSGFFPHSGSISIVIDPDTGVTPGRLVFDPVSNGTVEESMPYEEAVELLSGERITFSGLSGFAPGGTLCDSCFLSGNMFGDNTTNGGSLSVSVRFESLDTNLRIVSIENALSGNIPTVGGGRFDAGLPGVASENQILINISADIPLTTTNLEVLVSESTGGTDQQILPCEQIFFEGTSAQCIVNLVNDSPLKEVAFRERSEPLEFTISASLIDSKGASIASDEKSILQDKKSQLRQEYNDKIQIHGRRVFDRRNAMFDPPLIDAFVRYEGESFFGDSLGGYITPFKVSAEDYRAPPLTHQKLKDIVKALDAIRNDSRWGGFPIRITSGLRGPRENDRIIDRKGRRKSRLNSEHQLGTGVDINPAYDPSRNKWPPRVECKGIVYLPRQNRIEGNPTRFSLPEHVARRALNCVAREVLKSNTSFSACEHGKGWAYHTHIQSSDIRTGRC